MLAGRDLVLPYGIADREVGVGIVELDSLLSSLA
jgi:hypothetical protein